MRLFFAPVFRWPVFSKLNPIENQQNIAKSTKILYFKYKIPLLKYKNFILYTHRSKKQHRRPAVSLSNSMRETRETHQAGVKNHLIARIKRYRSFRYLQAQKPADWIRHRSLVHRRACSGVVSQGIRLNKITLLDYL